VRGRMQTAISTSMVRTGEVELVIPRATANPKPATPPRFPEVSLRRLSTPLRYDSPSGLKKPVSAISFSRQPPPDQSLQVERHGRAGFALSAAGLLH